MDSFSQGVPAASLKRLPDTFGIYVHFPYCLQKCSYCDFYSVGIFSGPGDSRVENSVPQPLIARFESVVLRELEARTPDFSTYRSVDSIYFGGGTSSLLSPEVIARLLEAFRARFHVQAGCEITLEGNPENMRPQYLEALFKVGVNRVNVGIQTFDRGLLESVNRYYDSERYSSILSDLAACPIPNFGVDLIYGFPGQTFEAFKRDLDAVCSIPLKHLSVYSLTVEAGTPYAAAVSAGRAASPDDALQEEIFSTLPGILRQRGLCMYEVSNYAVPGYECRHNLRYWLCESYLGLGPGAHGFDGVLRYGNPRNTEGWEARPAAAKKNPADPFDEMPLNLLRIALPFEVEFLSQILVEGAGRLQRAGISTGDPAAAAAAGMEVLAKWAEAGLAVIEGGKFQWNLQGLLRLDDRVAEMVEALRQSAWPSHDDASFSRGGT